MDSESKSAADDGLLLDPSHLCELLVQSVRDFAIFAVDRDGFVRSWNPGAANLTGYGADEVLGRHVSLLFPEDDLSDGKPLRALAQAAREGRYEDEGWRVRKDGTRFWAHVSVSPLRDRAGEVIGFVEVGQDVSERREAERLLRESEERLRLLVESVRDYAIFMLDANGRVVTWNAGAERLKGYARKEILGQHVAIFYTREARAAGRPDELLARAAENGRVEDQGWRVRADGSRFWADVVISSVRSEDGALIGFAKVTRDLTARRLAEEALRASEQRFRLLLDSVREYAIVMLDPDGNVVTWNQSAERLQGYRADEIVGRSFSRFYTRADLEAGKPQRELALAAAEGRFEEEGWRVRKDGARFWANVVVSPVRDASGALVGFAKVIRDLTDRRRAEEERLRLAQMQEALRMRDEFLSIAAHELRTPLTALQLSLESLIERPPPLTPVAAPGAARAERPGRSSPDRLRRAVRSTERLSQLVETLLDVSRLSTGKLTLTPAPVELNALVREVVERLSETAAQAGCPLTLALDGELRGIWDRLRIEQVVTNLLANAFKYAAGTPVRIATHREGACAILEVDDRGPGIPAEHLDRIFGRFQRAASLQHYGGLGLGLYVTQELVVAHHGSVVAENLPGRGIRFRVRLPLEPAF